jgi:two-component system, OmpR family, response regulator
LNGHEGCLCEGFTGHGCLRNARHHAVPRGCPVPIPPPAVEPPVITFSSPSTPRRSGLPALKLKILVVDDNRDAADTLAALLMLCGADVRVCYDGATGIREATEFRPDVGLFDVNMPWMGGCELAQRVRAGAGGRPILLVAVTGVSDPDAMRRTAVAGFNLHLTKPADPAGLVATLADFDWWLRARTGTPGA